MPLSYLPFSYYGGFNVSIIKTAIFWITAMLYFGLFKHSLTLDLQISSLVGYFNKIHIFLVYMATTRFDSN